MAPYIATIDDQNSWDWIGLGLDSYIGFMVSGKIRIKYVSAREDTEEEEATEMNIYMAW